MLKHQTLGIVFLGKMAIGLEYALKRTGPMSMAPSQLGVFAMSDNSYETPNLQFHVQPLSLDKFGDPLHDFPGLLQAYAILILKVEEVFT